MLADVPVSVNGIDLAPLTIASKSPIIEAKEGEKVTIPLVHKRHSDFSGDKIQMKVIGAGFERAPGFDLSVKAEQSEVVFDLKALNVPPGEYRVSFLGAGVVKYRHRPELVASVEEVSKKIQVEVKALEAEVKEISTEAQNAPAAKKELMNKNLASMNAKMKAATTALNATQLQLNQAKEAAQPKDIADIVVCEPFTIRVTPKVKK